MIQPLLFMWFLIITGGQATPVQPVCTGFEVGGFCLQLFDKIFTVQAINKSVPTGGTWGKVNNFSFVPNLGLRTGCHRLGDITVRIQPSDETNGSKWATYSSASFQTQQRAPAVNGTGSQVLTAHDITSFLNNTDPKSPPPYFQSIPITVVRSYEKAESGIVIRFNVTNSWHKQLRLGGLGMSLPQASNQHGIEESVWHDPHIGGDHGFVEWVRVVVNETTMLTVPRRTKSSASTFEAWRPVLEDNCRRDTWEWTVYSQAWANDWKENKQYPFLQIDPKLNQTIWSKTRSPWPSWHANETVPITDFDGIAQPWNTPTAKILKPGETISVAIQFILVKGGPRGRDTALESVDQSIVHAVPGYVLSPDMESAKLFVQPSKGTIITNVSVSDNKILHAAIMKSTKRDQKKTKYTVIDVKGISRGRSRVTVNFNDGTSHQVHYSVVPSFEVQVTRLGHHFAHDAWLPREFIDPFGRSASVMPWDREDKIHVLDDSRAYDVGLSDDAGGGNPLGFAMKVAYAPLQDEVKCVDDYIKWTLYGIKTDTAKPPYKSLQIRPEDVESGAARPQDLDGIRMTMYYYSNAGQPDPHNSGNFPYEYLEVDKCGIYNGGEGGPNWCMSESLANDTYRAFNYPHHTASYYAMYRVARNTNLNTYQSWQWYLHRAANTTIKFGAPSVGVMDGTLFREVLRSIKEEAQTDPTQWSLVAQKIESNMYIRAKGFASEEYPYGSEFAFDTTGQEEVVTWLMHFANSSNGWNAAAKRTVDHILSYMRSSPTWAYHGGARSWGDLGNNGKWFVTAGTQFETRGNMHYRTGLNMIPLIEWYRANPDDFFLLEVAMGAQAGQMTNIDDNGAPSMMLHMEPHILDFDPHSGDFGLGFFGHTLEAGSYWVQHNVFGDLCFLCNIIQGSDDLELGHGHENNNNSVILVPVDSYRQRFFLEPLALYLQADTGTFYSIAVDLTARRIEVIFVPVISNNFSIRRLRVDKQSNSRPGKKFNVIASDSSKTFPYRRNAYEIPVAITKVVVVWSK